MIVYLNIENLTGENFGMSIKICTLYFEGKYRPDYVEKLYNGLKRHCTLPFEFICYSDNPNVKADVKPFILSGNVTGRTKDKIFTPESLFSL